MPTSIPQSPIVLFDGVCNLCNASVQFILERDAKERFRFASLQSEAGQQLLQQFHLPTNDFDTFLLVEGDTYYTRSTAALRVARNLHGAWKYMYVFIAVPKFLRDAVYGFVARNRYQWFGKQETCWMPTPELKARFLA